MADERPPCTCGNNGICVVCVLDALEEEEAEALRKLLENPRG